jgi:adenine-specific DNA-methyltransferase
MGKTYTGSLSLEWYNKQKSIALLNSEQTENALDIAAPKINWVNKDEALFYEIDTEDGIGQRPYWVNRNDIRVKEARPLELQKLYFTVSKDKVGTIPGTHSEIQLKEAKNDDEQVENILIKGDNLLALNTLKKIFENKRDEEKIKCIYLDPPYTTGQAFENYDDNLAQSEWLTLMRDRLKVLHELLRQDGVLFIQLDEKNIFHVRVMLDEIFGKLNFTNLFTVKTSDPSGLKTVNPSPYDSAEYIIMYAKHKPSYKYETLYVECDYDSGYSKFIENINEPYSKWKITSLNEYYANKKGYPTIDSAKKAIGKLDFLSAVGDFAKENCESVFQATAIADDAGRDIVELRDKSKNNPDKIYHLKRESDEIYILNGRQVYFYKNKIRVIDGRKVPTIQLTNIWNDIPYNGISKEGGVKFKESKKPEKLIKRIIEVANSKEGDYILDCFAGSGTTCAVAHKMKRKWIAVEIGNHADTHILPRMKSVLSGSDDSGVTESIKWKGGGSFKYYHLGQSIIKIQKEGTSDFNWSLGKKFIEESFLLSYDYSIDKSLNLSANKLFTDMENLPLIGIQKNGSKNRVAIVSLNGPKDKLGNISYDELQSLYKAVVDKFSPEYINIFTNRGIEIAYDSKPDDLEVIKVPHAIFAELEK